MRCLFVPLLAACVLSALSANATVVLDLPLPELAQRSALVVRGHVVEQHAAWTPDHREISTRTKVRILETWRGTAPADGTLIVNQPGGEVDGIGEHAEGAASFLVGEEVVLFLEPHRERAAEYTLVSLAAAKFSVRRAGSRATAERDLRGLTFASRGPDGHVRPSPEAHIASLPLESLKSAVRGESHR